MFLLRKSIQFILLAISLTLCFAVQAKTNSTAANKTNTDSQDTSAAKTDFLNSLFHKANDPIAGNPNGKVTIIEFFDYDCSHCVNMAPVIAAIIKNNPDVRVVFKEFPIRGPMSEAAARAALAANMQGKYYPYHHALLTSDKEINEATMTSIAKSLGLNIKKWNIDMHSKDVQNQINANYAIAKKLNITGTPALFIGKTNESNTKNVYFVLGEMSKSELQNAINTKAKP